MALAFNPIRPRSLRGQLVGLVAALVVPLVTLQVWWGYRESQRAEEAVVTQALAIADATALSLRQFLAQAEATVTGTSTDFGRQLLTGQACGPAMQTLVNLFPSFSNVTTVNRDGSLACSANPVPEGTSATSWAWFPEMAEAEDPQYTIAGPVLGPMSGEWILPLVAPIVDEQGRFAGAVVGSVPLVGFARFMSGDRQGADLLVTIATAEHIVIARSEKAELWVGQPLPPRRGTDEAVGPRQRIATGPDFEDVDRRWGEVQLENGWWVYAGIPAETIFGPARATTARQIGITLLIVLLSMLFAARFYRQIGSALRELASGIPVTREGGAVPVPVGTPIEFRPVVQQFNETLRSRNRAEEAERAARERYQSIFDNAVFGLFVATADGRFLEVNASLVSMLGFESTPALIEAGPDALYASPGQFELLIQEALQLRVIQDWELEWVRADGPQISVRLNGKIIRTAEDEIAVQVIVQDITDEKRKENELRQTQKMEAIGKLAGGVAHDFNNLLTVIGGNTELIEDAIPTDDPLREELAQVLKATERAASLTAQLLAFSRKEPRATRPVDVNEVITDMERMLVRLISEDVTLEARLSSHLRPISIDSVR